MGPTKTNKGSSGSGAHASSAAAFDIEDFQTQLWDLCDD